MRDSQWKEKMKKTFHKITDWRNSEKLLKPHKNYIFIHAAIFSKSCRKHTGNVSLGDIITH